MAFYIDQKYSQKAKKLLKESKDRNKVNFYLSLSNLGDCTRKLLLQIQGIHQEEPDLQRLYIFRDGDLHEDNLEPLLKELGIELMATQVPFNLPVDVSASFLPRNAVGKACPVCKAPFPERGLHGHIDFWVKNPETDKIEILEHKAISREFFNRTVQVAGRSGKDFFLFHRKYVVQLGSYLVGQALVEKKSASGSLLFKNKDNAAYAEARLHYSLKKDELFLESIKVQPDNWTASLNFRIKSFYQRLKEKVKLLHEVIEGQRKISDLPVTGTCLSCSALFTCRDHFKQGPSAELLFDGAEPVAHKEAPQELAQAMLRYREVLDKEQTFREEKERLYALYERFLEQENSPDAIFVTRTEKGQFLGLFLGRTEKMVLDLEGLNEEAQQKVFDLNRRLGFLKKKTYVYPVVRALKIIAPSEAAPSSRRPQQCDETPPPRKEGTPSQD